jgi:predicted nicotinamide N-methyase
MAVAFVEEVVSLGSCELVLLRPRDADALIDEEAFRREEFLPYWAELWPSALALARAVATRPLEGARVVELGCGLALPSIAAALGGARVLATDWSSPAVSLAAQNAVRNGAAVEVAVCSWTSPGRLLLDAPWNLVLASDVLYERRNVEPLLELLPRLVGREGEVLLTDPGRPPAATFLARAAEEWRVETVADPLSTVTVHRLARRDPGLEAPR